MQKFSSEIENDNNTLHLNYFSLFICIYKYGAIFNNQQINLKNLTLN